MPKPDATDWESLLPTLACDRCGARSEEGLCGACKREFGDEVAPRKRRLGRSAPDPEDENPTSGRIF